METPSGMLFKGMTFPVLISIFSPISTLSPTRTPSGACIKAIVPFSYFICANGALWPCESIKSVIFPTKVSTLKSAYLHSPLYLKLGALYLGPPLPLACCIRFLPMSFLKKTSEKHVRHSVAPQPQSHELPSFVLPPTLILIEL